MLFSCQNISDSKSKNKTDNQNNNKIQSQEIASFINEFPLFRVENYRCVHGCNHSFKSKKQMILHHDKIDSFCQNEKMLLIKLIESYQNSLEQILHNDNKFKQTHEYLDLKEQFKRTKDCSMDKCQLESLIEQEENM